MVHCCFPRGPGRVRTNTRSSFRDHATGARRSVLNVGDSPKFVPPGHLTYGRLDALFAVPWREHQAAVGDVAPISLPELPRLENEGASDYVVSANGTLAYIAGGPARYAQRPVWVDRAGVVEALPMPERDYEAVALSPDGAARRSADPRRHDRFVAVRLRPADADAVRHRLGQQPGGGMDARRPSHRLPRHAARHTQHLLEAD